MNSPTHHEFRRNNFLLLSFQTWNGWVFFGQSVDDGSMVEDIGKICVEQVYSHDNEHLRFP